MEASFNKAASMRFMTATGPVDVVRFDGFPFGEVALEGVMFYARVVDDDVVVEVEHEARDYLASLDPSNELMLKAKSHILGGGEPLESIDGRAAWLMRV